MGEIMNTMKKFLILGFLVSLTSAFAFAVPGAIGDTTGSGKTVILVSDNPADNATVNNIECVMSNAVIIHTPWGQYNQTVVSEIMAENPENVLIVGGPMAVPDEYSKTLNKLNISVKRIYGKNRYETNKKVFEWVKSHYRHKLKLKKVIIVHGDDETSINDTNALIILSNGSNLSINESELKEINATSIVVIKSVFNNSLVLKRLKNHGFNVSTHSIDDSVLKHVVENKYLSLNLKIKLNGNDELKNDLDKIKELIDKGEYQEAYKLEIQLNEKLILHKAKLNMKNNNVKLKIHVKSDKYVGNGKIETESNNSVSSNIEININSNNLIKNSH